MAVNESLQAGDHDFTKFGIIPSVTFLFDVPDNIEGLWYTGNVYLGVKDSIFEAPSPLWHACELYSILCLCLHKNIFCFCILWWP